MNKEEIEKILTDLAWRIETEHYDYHYDAILEAVEKLVTLEDKEIADNMRGYWANLNTSSADWRG